MDFVKRPRGRPPKYLSGRIPTLYYYGKKNNGTPLINNAAKAAVINAIRVRDCVENELVESETKVLLYESQLSELNEQLSSFSAENDDESSDEIARDIRDLRDRQFYEKIEIHNFMENAAHKRRANIATELIEGELRENDTWLGLVDRDIFKGNGLVNDSKKIILSEVENALKNGGKNKEMIPLPIAVFREISHGCDYAKSVTNDYNKRRKTGLLSGTEWNPPENESLRTAATRTTETEMARNAIVKQQKALQKMISVESANILRLAKKYDMECTKVTRAIAKYEEKYGKLPSEITGRQSTSPQQSEKSPSPSTNTKKKQQLKQEQQQQQQQQLKPPVKEKQPVGRPPLKRQLEMGDGSSAAAGASPAKSARSVSYDSGPKPVLNPMTWSAMEREWFRELFCAYGRDWDTISRLMCGVKSTAEVKKLFNLVRNRTFLASFISNSSSSHMQDMALHNPESGPTASSSATSTSTLSSTAAGATAKGKASSGKTKQAREGSLESQYRAVRTVMSDADRRVESTRAHFALSLTKGIKIRTDYNSGAITVGEIVFAHIIPPGIRSDEEAWFETLVLTRKDPNGHRPVLFEVLLAGTSISVWVTGKALTRLAPIGAKIYGPRPDIHGQIEADHNGFGAAHGDLDNNTNNRDHDHDDDVDDDDDGVAGGPRSRAHSNSNKSGARRATLGSAGAGAHRGTESNPAADQFVFSRSECVHRLEQLVPAHAAALISLSSAAVPNKAALEKELLNASSIFERDVAGLCDDPESEQSVFANASEDIPFKALEDNAVLQQRFDTVVFATHLAVEWLRARHAEKSSSAAKSIRCPADSLVPAATPVQSHAAKRARVAGGAASNASSSNTGSGAAAGGAGGLAGGTDLVRIDVKECNLLQAAAESKSSASAASRLFHSIFSFFSGSAATPAEVAAAKKDTNAVPKDTLRMLGKVKIIKREVIIEAARLLRAAALETNRVVQTLIDSQVAGHRGAANYNFTTPGVSDTMIDKIQKHINTLRAIRLAVIAEANGALLKAINSV